jgi:hypothetical protein
MTFNVFNVYGAESSVWLSNRRSGLHFNEFIFEIASWKCCDYLMPLVGSDLFISDPDDVHENTRVCESYLRSHVLRDPWSGMQSDSLPN